jgi:PEP-CTERM motif
MSSKSWILGVCSIIVAMVLLKSIVYGVTLTLSLESLSNFSQLLTRVPEPLTMVLLGAGLILLSVWRRKRLINKH